MNRAARPSDRFRLAGLLLAAVGVCAHQLPAPFLGAFRPFITLGGTLLTLAGLVVIATGVRRRIARDTATGDHNSLSSS